MNRQPYGQPNNSISLGVLGYLVVANRQVHSYQISVINEYLQFFGLTIEDTVIADIVDGREDAVSVEQCLTALKGESPSIIEDILFVLYMVAAVDNSIDATEETMLSHVSAMTALDSETLNAFRKNALDSANAIRSMNNTLFERPTSSADQKDKDHQLTFFGKLMKMMRDWFSAPQPALPACTGFQEDEYVAAIARCAEIASEDFDFVYPVYDCIMRSGQESISALDALAESLPLESEVSASASEVVRAFSASLRSNVLLQQEKSRESLLQKQRTVQDFTISLIGRTKAGKSTLHAILTNQGTDSIGVGKQRTTRYNRVFQWNLLRLIDTPGIGSAEAEGRSDDEIAESILGESDVVCFVVVDDSILEDVFSFIKKVVERNKPVIILLNHKENIRPEVKFKRFMKDPNRWLSDTGEDRLSGHIDRIKRYARAEGFESSIHVYPVFLLAAQMAGEEGYAQNGDLLWESSNIESFIDELKHWIVVSGAIKRSQTILDEASCLFSRDLDQVDLLQQPVERQLQSLNTQRAGKIDALNEAKARALQRIERCLESEFEKLASQDALVFAEETYRDSGDLSEKWRDYLARIQFEENLKSAVESELVVFQRKAGDTVQELFEDCYFTMRTSFSVAEVKVPIQFDFKGLTRLFGGGLGLAGAIVLAVLGISNPVGLTLFAAGAVIGLGSALLKSPDARRRKAVDKIANSIREDISRNVPEQIKAVVHSIERELDDSIAKIDALFEQIESGLNATVDISNALKRVYQSCIAEINDRYAQRIIEYLFANSDESVERTEGLEILSVDRSIKGRIVIKCKEIEIDGSALKGVIADEVIVTRKGE